MKKFVTIILSIALVMSLAACGKKEEKTVLSYSPGESLICIYYPQGNEVLCREEKYQLKQPDSVNASVEEVMSILAENIDNGMEYKTYMISEDGELSLEFQRTGECSDEYELLTKAAVVQTLLQINDIKNIIIEVSDQEGVSLSENRYNRNSFFFYGYDSEMELNTTTLRLYYADESGEKLTSSYYTFKNQIDISIPEQVIEELVNMGALPKGTKVENLSINSGVCYLQLSDNFKKSINGVKSEVVLYSVVNSLVSISGIDSVKLSFESGDNLYMGKYDISIPLFMNVDIVE
ncbi:MAG: GerMN domain-containing protein [Wujia sp.]